MNGGVSTELVSWKVGLCVGFVSKWVGWLVGGWVVQCEYDSIVFVCMQLPAYW